MHILLFEYCPLFFKQVTAVSSARAFLQIIARFFIWIDKKILLHIDLDQLNSNRVE